MKVNFVYLGRTEGMGRGRKIVIVFRLMFSVLFFLATFMYSKSFLGLVFFFQVVVLEPSNVSVKELLKD